MIEIISLDFGNFRSFVEPQHIVFQGRDKLIQIDGRNENTGGSSGAGKTTVLMALDHLLGISDTASTVLQSRLTKEGLWVSGEFIIDGVPVSISRTKASGLTIKTPDETVSGNSKLAEEKLLSLIGLPIKIFKKMIHKKQKEGGFFLNMTPKETYEFLIAVLGLEKYITDIDKINEESAKYIEEINSLNQTIELGKSSILDINRILSEKTKPPEPTATDEEIHNLNGKVLSLLSDLRTVRERTADEISALTPPVRKEMSNPELDAQILALIPARAELKARLDSTSLSKAKVESDLGKIPLLMDKAVKIGADISKLKEGKLHIEQSQCPTCMQKWTGETAQDKIAKIDLEIKASIEEALLLKKSIEDQPRLKDTLGMLLKTVEEINTQLAALQDSRAALDAQKYLEMGAVIEENQKAKDAFDKQVLEIESKSRSIIDGLNQELKQTEMEHTSKEIERHSYLMSLDRYEKDVASITSVLNKKKASFEYSIEVLQVVKHKIMVIDESKRLIKAYVLQTFQETLDAIGEQATNILAAIPNMATSTIYFEGCKETKSGSIKDEVVAILNSDGNNDIPIKSLSGGERTAIDLAIDLAVIDVIETKASKGANFLFMDEPFDGLDSVCKENCLEILKQIDTNKKIIMVDHSSELKEMVSDVILVVKQGETSSIMVL